MKNCQVRKVANSFNTQYQSRGELESMVTNHFPFGRHVWEVFWYGMFDGALLGEPMSNLPALFSFTESTMGEPRESTQTA